MVEVANYRRGQTMDMRLEVIMVPVSDVDKAKSFYMKLGFREDIDLIKDDYRVV